MSRRPAAAQSVRVGRQRRGTSARFVRKATQENSTFENIRRLICSDRISNVPNVISLSITSAFSNNTSKRSMHQMRIRFYVQNVENSSEVRQI